MLTQRVAEHYGVAGVRVASKFGERRLGPRVIGAAC